MSLEDKVIEVLNELDEKQKKVFGIFCLERVIYLYKKIDETEDLSKVDSSIKKGEAFKLLESIFNQVKKENSIKNIDELIDTCDLLILDTEELFDNTTENEVSSLVAQGVDYLLRFIKEKEPEYIEYCSSNNIEILNQLKSEEFYIKSGSKATDEEIMEYVEIIFEKEYKIQLQSLQLIKKGDFNLLEDLKNKSIIEWSN
ncbi:hypothetical protein Q4603_18855 [Zobellia galactanivorans]|uniref:hypothetical protein n=1 Tax=Zobellia galactanivorans (strain DSM 12802 / CCUG 47099 / CIP 106680 / NCIMB 13871 / Dsij) TaxID=63186 RepID=UPI0026E2D79E|nr:hypothetical protein [Zobellia galactanivorans]MDO6810691.1 hypothetical protein [Zobellia galactanivorans]